MERIWCVVCTSLLVPSLSQLHLRDSQVSSRAPSFGRTRLCQLSWIRARSGILARIDKLLSNARRSVRDCVRCPDWQAAMMNNKLMCNSVCTRVRMRCPFMRGNSDDFAEITSWESVANIYWRAYHYVYSVLLLIFTDSIFFSWIWRTLMQTTIFHVHTYQNRSEIPRATTTRRRHLCLRKTCGLQAGSFPNDPRVDLFISMWVAYLIHSTTQF